MILHRYRRPLGCSAEFGGGASPEHCVSGLRVRSCSCQSSGPHSLCYRQEALEAAFSFEYCWLEQGLLRNCSGVHLGRSSSLENPRFHSKLHSLAWSSCSSEWCILHPPRKILNLNRNSLAQEHKASHTHTTGSGSSPALSCNSWSPPSVLKPTPSPDPIWTDLLPRLELFLVDLGPSCSTIVCWSNPIAPSQPRSAC